jgi:hypothetical protein
MWLRETMLSTHPNHQGILKKKEKKNPGEKLHEAHGADIWLKRSMEESLGMQ